MIVLHDIDGCAFQMMVRHELPHADAITLVRFNDEYFAEQFVKWLKVEPVHWCERFNLHRDTVYKQLAKMMVEGSLRFAKLPSSYAITRNCLQK